MSTWKWIFVTVIAVIVIYAIFSTSASAYGSQAEMDAAKNTFNPQNLADLSTSYMATNPQINEP